MDYGIDIFFFMDIILTFFVPVYVKSRFLTSHKLIAKNYVTGIWFWVDIASILPVGLFLKSEQDYNLLVKIFKLPRFYKMVNYG